MLKSLFATVAIAATSLIAAPAEAAGPYCYVTSNEAYMCIHRVRSHNTLGNAQKEVLWSSDGGTVYRDIVDCTEASPSNYKRNLWGIACYEFN